MFNKKDYLNYFKQLYAIELEMKKEIEDLIKITNNAKSKVLLQSIRNDEIRHALIVKDLIKLV
jgi:hypothetical protein